MSFFFAHLADDLYFFLSCKQELPGSAAESIPG
jgi:hypothetical protein